MSAEAQLADVLDWLWSTRPPATVEAKARLVMLDTIGCALAGFAHQKVRVLQAGAGPAAGFAAAACWDEACEGLARAHGRPGVAALAALQALAPARKATVGEVIAAFLAGYEAGGRLGEALRIAPGMHVDATWPSLGAAVAAVHLLKGSTQQALAAARIAGCQMPRSLYLPVKSGAEARNTYLAHAAQLGLLAAQSALAGFTAPEGVLEELGAAKLAPPGEWLILESYLKPFAAVRHVHYAAAAAMALRKRIPSLEKIESIRLRTYGEAITYCGNRAPRTAIQAQFSLSYGLAHALVFGSLDPDSYADARLRDPILLRLEALVAIEEDKALTAAGSRAARITLVTGKDSVEGFVDHVHGDPSAPLTREDVLAKFARYTGGDGAALLDADSGEPFSIPT